MKRNKHFYTMVCMILGVVMLTTAAFANFDNANGYAAYKNAILNILYAENFTLSADVSMLFDDEVIENATIDTMFDAHGDVRAYSKTKSGNGGSDHGDWTMKSETDSGHYQLYNWDDEWRMYDTNVDETETNMMASVTGDADTSEKLVRVVELLADAFVGDLKNNFVLIDNNDGMKTYQVSLSGNQLPEIVNAGLSLMYSALRDSYSWNGVSVEEFSRGDDMSAEEYDELYSALRDKGYELFEEKNHMGRVYVDLDGTTTWYENPIEYYESNYDDMEDFASAETFFLGAYGEPWVDTAKCFVTIDENGNLVNNELEGTLVGRDANGNLHSLSLRATINLSDYGTTTIEKPVIPSNATIYDYRGQSYENGYSYVITRNGITVEQSQESDRIANEVKWLSSLGEEEFIEFVQDLADRDVLEEYLQDYSMTIEDLNGIWGTDFTIDAPVLS